MFHSKNDLTISRELEPDAITNLPGVPKPTPFGLPALQRYCIFPESFEFWINGHTLSFGTSHLIVPKRFLTADYNSERGPVPRSHSVHAERRPELRIKRPTMIDRRCLRTLLERPMNDSNRHSSRPLLCFASIALALALTTSGFAQATSDASKPSAQAKSDPAAQPAATPIHPALVQVAEDPKLPRVLLIGDSITMGYTPTLREMLKKVANVQHPTENCGASRRTVEHLDQYLGDKPWDVIQLNCGIHDLTYLNAAGKVATPAEGAKVQVPLDEYRANLEKIVARLEKTGAKLIWCTTTPLRNPPAFRLTDDVARYNEVALEVMQKHNIQVNDLNEQILKHGPSMWTFDGVHFSPEGYGELAKCAAPVIESALPKAGK